MQLFCTCTSAPHPAVVLCDSIEGIWFGFVLVVRVWCETTLGDRGANWLVVLLCVCVAAVRLMSSGESILGGSTD